MKKIKLLITLIIIIFSSFLYSQDGRNSDLFEVNTFNISKTFTLPFEYINNFIVVKARINKKFPLHFIFDTGAENTIFIMPSVVNYMGLRLYKEFKIMGADYDQLLIAYLTRGISFSFSEFDVSNLDALVFKENYLDLDPFIGKQIAGIIGANFFKGKLIKINFKTQIIEIIPFNNFDEKNYSDYTKIKMEVKNDRGFINTKTIIGNDTVTLKLMIDTGAATTALIHANKAQIKIPESSIPSNIANGLGGEIKGFVGRIPNLDFGELSKKEVIVNFQDLPDSTNIRITNGRDGILGNAILDNFIVVYDNIRGYLYLKPLKQFYKKDKYDRSGIFLLSTGENLNNIEIHQILKNSPADQAGLLPGDKIIKINGWGKGFISLGLANRIFHKKIGKKIKLKILRDGKILRKYFNLRELL